MELSDSPATSDPRVYFAAERTLLAWMRTGLALMGFGFIVARFGLFLRELAAVHHNAATKGTGFSLFVGVGLVLLGVAMTALAAARHYRWVRHLRHGTATLPGALSLATVAAVALALLGLVIVAVLVLGVVE